MIRILSVSVVGIAPRLEEYTLKEFRNASLAASSCLIHHGKGHTRLTASSDGHVDDFITAEISRVADTAVLSVDVGKAEIVEKMLYVNGRQ